MGRLGVIASTILLMLPVSSSAGLAGQSAGKIVEQRIDAATPKSDTGVLYSCRPNPKQPPTERRKKVSLICTPVLTQ